MKKSSSHENSGLYVKQAEKDACGVGLIADLNGIPTSKIVDSALRILENMEHRGACGCEENTGDGAGILVQIPHTFFIPHFTKAKLEIPTRGKYGVGMFFLPRSESKRAYCQSVIEKQVKRFDFEIFYQRPVPRNHQGLGKTALDSEPVIQQLFFKSTGFNYKELERRFYLLRSSILKEIYFSDQQLTDDFYIASLSSKTIVYKGLLTAHQLRQYFVDLQSPDFMSAVAIVHSRFSTNTIPKWKLAQPFRCIAHNGEINTIQGNLNWWRARERHLEEVSGEHPDLIKVFPVCDPFLSDSGNFDNVVDFLLHASRSIPHSMMMMIPEAWQNDQDMEDYKRAFYEYHDGVMEPWDGPASICFTDGSVLGATLDRNGLRPARYLITRDNLLIVASEAGCLNIDESKIVKKGRLEPGKMLVADLDEKRIYTDEEVKNTICKRKPYRKWLNENSLHLDDLEPRPTKQKVNLSRQQLQVAFGMSQEDEKLILKAMVEGGKEPIGSMGSDIPLAVLSTIPQHIANYFKQQFAQVTNPPIDSLREDFYMSLSTTIGGGSRFISIYQEAASLLRLDHPFLTEYELNAIMHIGLKQFKSYTLDICFDANDEHYEAAIKSKCLEVYDQVKKGARIICLSDRKISKFRKPIPSLLMTGALHHDLINRGWRKEVALIVESGDIWESQHMATLLSYGADLLMPYLAYKCCAEIGEKVNLVADASIKKYIKAANKALLKIMSKLGVSTLSSYKGAQTFEALGISKEVVDLCFLGTVTRIGGMRFSDLEKENELRHHLAFFTDVKALPDLGTYKWNRKGEFHLFNPQSIHLLQHSTKTNCYSTYLKFAQTIDSIEKNASTLRSFFRIKKGQSIPLDEVESIDQILKRFVTGAMSYGSISHEAHVTLAKAMNQIGGKSNSGEGGEDEARFTKNTDGSWERSAIKQVASGRLRCEYQLPDECR